MIFESIDELAYCRLSDQGSTSQTLALLPPLGKKITSSNPTASSGIPHTIMKLAVATNKVGVGVLATSQSSLDRYAFNI